MAISYRRGWVWLFRGLLVSVLLLCLLLLVVAVLLWRQGLRVDGVGWQQGLSVQQWRWYQDDCVLAQGDELVVSVGWPLQAQQRTLTLFHCAGEVTPLPFDYMALQQRAETLMARLSLLPPLSLQVDALRLPLLEWPQPPVSFSLSHQQSRWVLVLAAPETLLQASLAVDSGIWALQGHSELAPWLVDAGGQVSLDGSGRWRQGTVDGHVRLTLDQLTLADEIRAQWPLPLRGLGKLDGRVDIEWARGHWRLRAVADEVLSLGYGWWLYPGELLMARGDGAQVQRLQALLRAGGPEGDIELSLHSDTDPRQQGRGRVLLAGGELDGAIAFSWQDQSLTVAPFRLQGPETLTASLAEALTLPLARQGQVALPLRLGWQQLQLESQQAQLEWQGTDWFWQGLLTLRGSYQDYDLSGTWQGRLDAEGASNGQAELVVENALMELRLNTTVSQWGGPDSRLPVSVQGHYQGWPIQAQGTLQQQGGAWHGSLSGRSTLAGLSQGGDIRLSGDWHWQDGVLALSEGSTAEIARGLRDDWLIRALSLRAQTPLQMGLGDEGLVLHGTLTVDGGGLVAADWQLPAYQGDVALQGQQFVANLSLPAWQGELALDGRWLEDMAAGEMTLSLPLRRQIGKTLGVIFTGGQLASQGHWIWHGQPYGRARLAVEDLAVSWGSIEARGGNGQMLLHWQEGQPRLRSLSPLSVVTVDLGVPLSSLSFQLDTDLSNWWFTDVQAAMLGGQIRAPALNWPSTEYQPVVATRIDLTALAALQNQPVVALQGRVGGYMPVKLLSDSLAISGGRLGNEGPLQLRLLPSPALQGMAASNTAVRLALESVELMDISSLLGYLEMSEDGWLDARISLHGVNPDKRRLPVVFNYSHRENVFDLLRSLRIGDDIADQFRESWQ